MSQPTITELATLLYEAHAVVQLPARAVELLHLGHLGQQLDTPPPMLPVEAVSRLLSHLEGLLEDAMQVAAVLEGEHI